MKKIFALLILVLCIPLFAQDKQESERIIKKAEELYDQRKFTESLNEWLVALELDPGNEKLQLKIETLYEEKHKKDISLQKSKYYYWEARALLDTLRKGSTEFHEKEFRDNKLDVKALTDLIKKDNYPFPRNLFKKPDGTVDRLNEIIAYPLFYELWSRTKNITSDIEEFNSLVRWTQYYRSKPAELLTDQELDNILRLNRYIIEITYPDNAPQSLTGKKQSKKKRAALLDDASDSTKRAVDNFIAAYRIEPTDPDLVRMLEQMKYLQQDLDAELEKKRISEEKIRLYNEAITAARDDMSKELFPEAVTEWINALKIMPQDNYAKEELRKAELAVSNRIKYENIKALLLSARGHFVEKSYSAALAELKQVIDLDSKNREALDGIGKIEKILYETELAAKRRIQAEQFYASGLHNLEINNFDDALDDFNNTASLIPDYKDVQSRIKSIASLRKIYEERILRQKLQEIDKEFQNGLLAFSVADYKSALISFERTLVLDPNNETAKRFLRTVKDALRQEQEEVIDQSSPYYDLVSSLMVNGRVLYENGRYTESEENWLKILKLFPQNLIATQYLAKCQLKTDPEKFKSFSEKTIADGKEFLNKKDYKAALRKFELLKSISPEYPGIDGLIASARRDVKKAAVAPNLSTATPEELNRKYEQGLALYRKGGKENLLRARDSVKFATDRDPENAKALVLLNRIESELRLFGEQTATAVRKLTPEQEKKVRELYFKGINYYSNNRFQDAIAEWRKVLAIDPNHEKAKNNIRQCLILLKQQK